jgi:phosphonate transport system permease protein
MRVSEPPRHRPLWFNAALVLATVAVYAWSAHGTETRLGEFFRGLPAMADFLTRMVPPDGPVLSRLWKPLVETVQLAIVGTTLGVVLAFPLSFLGARNFVGTGAVYYFTRGMFNTFRGISEFVYALLFVAMVGLGPFPGALALTIHTAGALGKYFSEAIENMNWQPIEAIMATGASRTQLVFHGVLPELTPQFLAYAFYYFEHNIRASTVLGLVGAGGLGIELLTSVKLFKYQEVATIILVMLVLITVADQLSAWARRRVLGTESAQA